MPTALITGASSGIGAAFARALASRGNNLILVARSEERLHTLAAELQAQHAIKVEVLVADLVSEAECARVETRLSEGTPPVDLLINNAGLGLKTRFGKGKVEEEEHLLRLNVLAVMRLTHAALGPMRERKSGQIINVSSVASFAPTSPGSTYSSTKSWVTNFSESLHLLLRPEGIKVLALCPGFTHSEFHARADLPIGVKGSPWWLDTDYVVQVALRDLARGKAISIPAWRYKFVVAAFRHVPRSLLYWMIQRSAKKRQSKMVH